MSPNAIRQLTVPLRSFWLCCSQTIQNHTNQTKNELEELGGGAWPAGGGRCCAAPCLGSSRRLPCNTAATPPGTPPPSGFIADFGVGKQSVVSRRQIRPETIWGRRGRTGRGLGWRRRRDLGAMRRRRHGGKLHRTVAAVVSAACRCKDGRGS